MIRSFPSTFTVLALTAAMLSVGHPVVAQESGSPFSVFNRLFGDNERAALYGGLPIRRTRIWVYTLCGLLSGVAGVLHAAQNHQVSA